MSGIALLTTEGGAHARGLAHGRRFAREIADNVATYLRRFAASGLGRDQAFAEATRWRKAIAGQDGAYSEEMRGIAEGSGETEDTIALLNARYELAFTLFGQEARTATKTAVLVGPDGCTTFALLPQAAADGHTWLGQNWDWLAGVHGRTFVLRARRTKEPSFVCLTEAGIAGGKMGVNECGIGLVGRTVSPRAATAAILIKRRSTCAAGRCWTRRDSRRRCSRSPARRAPAQPIS
jgi:isopenicillin-N N-acyltransferase-like protein